MRFDLGGHFMRIKKLFVLFSLVFTAATCAFATQAIAQNLNISQNAILNNLKSQAYFKIDADKSVLVSYNKGKTYINTHITLPKSSQPGESIQLSDHNIYISKAVTAIVFVDPGSGTDVYVSHDIFKTWTKTTIKAKATDPFTKGGYVPSAGDSYGIAFINFTSSQTGYIIFGGEPAMSQENNYVYQTTNGGKSWHEIPNATNFYEHDITGGGFASHTNGFICFTPIETTHGVIYATYNSGKTWVSLKMNYPSKYKDTSLTASSPRFNGKYGLMPICSTIDAANNSILFYMYTTDYGNTWHYLSK